MTRIAIFLCLLFVAASTTACSAKLKADLNVDDAKFELSGCRSGQVYGFRGVELKGKSGGKIRLVAGASGEAKAFFMASGTKTAIDMGKCGPFSVNSQKSTINGVTNVEGKATLDCKGGGHTVKGTVSFSNCH